MQVSTFRDLTLLKIDSSHYFTIACDSCGGIGMSELDLVKVEEEIVGYLTTKVCLFETLAFRAKPSVLINTLCVEMEGRGKRILSGIERAMKEYNEARFYEEPLEINITGSTEENILTLQTGLGITLMGEIYDPFKKEQISKGDAVFLVGYPKVGQEVIQDMTECLNEIISFQTLQQLVNQPNVVDLLPVGSKGVKYEIDQLVKTHTKEILLYKQQEILLEKSAGPATCVIVVVKNGNAEELKNLISQPITLLGEVI